MFTLVLGIMMYPLIANDNFGCSDTLTINNLVYIPGPILDFKVLINHLDVIH